MPPRKQTILVRCPHPSCLNLMPEGAKGCDDHKHLKPHKCADCGEIIYGQLVYCVNCKHERSLQAQKEYKAQVAKTYAQVEVAKPVPRKQVKIVKTAEQVDKECRKAERELAARRPLLNQEMLAQRLMQRCCVSVVY
jgi:hypothetical protein